MKTERRKDFISLITCILIAIVGILVCVEATYHTTNANAEQPKSLNEEITAPFEISNAGSIQFNEYEGDCEFTYYVDSTDSYINVFTSVIEGDCLKMYMDCLNLYSYNNSYEDIDDLQSYLLNNSRLKYISNQWFEGWIWIYDACPVYRFPQQ